MQFNRAIVVTYSFVLAILFCGCQKSSVQNEPETAHRQKKLPTDLIQITKKRPWYLDIDLLNTNEETKEFLRLTTKAALDIPKIVPEISDYDVQSYLENNVPELMNTKAGRSQIISNFEKLYSIPIIRKDVADKIIAAHDKNLQFDIEDEVDRLAGPQVKKIIKEFKTSIKYTKKSIDVNATPVDLIQTAEETAEWTKWRNKTFDDLVKDACSLDRGALYMLGMCHLLGYEGIPIDVNVANKYFSLSASLGFGPALDKVRAMYIEDYSNPWLALVYTNLTIVSGHGHHEFVQGYHKLRTQMTEKCGVELVQEIERLAAHKNKVISENQEALGKGNEKIISITSEDKDFNNTYWSRFCK